MSQPSLSASRTVPCRLIRPLALLAVCAAGAALGACGGSGANAAAKERASEQGAEARLARFARCMREHGVAAEAKTAPGGGTLMRVGGPGEAGSPQTMEAAQKACRRYQPKERKVSLSPQEKVKREEEVLRFAKCMREHGVDIHASASGGKVSVQVGARAPGGAGAGGPNPESPAFQAAQKACQGLLPGPKGGPGGGPKVGTGFSLGG